MRHGITGKEESMITGKLRMRWTAALAVFGIAVLFLGTPAPSQNPPAKTDVAYDVSSLVGNWRGESICQVRESACHDETVLYEIAKSMNDSSTVSITAYKLVSGRQVNMGSGDWKYNREQRTLVWETPMGAWKLVVEGNRMYGNLTLRDKTVFRRVTLKRDK